MTTETISIDQEGSDDGGVSDRRRKRLETAPIVLEARNVSKTFHIPDQKIQTFKERAVHPLRRQPVRTSGQNRGVRARRIH